MNKRAYYESETTQKQILLGRLGQCSSVAPDNSFPVCGEFNRWIRLKIRHSCRNDGKCLDFLKLFYQNTNHFQIKPDICQKMCLFTLFSLLRYQNHKRWGPLIQLPYEIMNYAVIRQNIRILNAFFFSKTAFSLYLCLSRMNEINWALDFQPQIEILLQDQWTHAIQKWRNENKHIKRKRE